ncbi:MAG TPA: hypothetical protein PLQ19_03675 [Aeromicrobium sp.]|nr:hypothetical protein [Aeromicrobium sp.]
MTLRSLRLLVAVLLGTVASVVGLSSPATAAGCAAGTGVTVVVGNGVRCDPNDSGKAHENFAAAGHSLSYASRSPGFVCRVDGAPASDPCTVASPADAYWGLFWSDGKSGKWVYSSLGVTSLDVPKGGWVAFVFQNSDSKTWPSMKPIAQQPVAPKPTAKPTTKPTPKPKATPSASAATPSTGASPSPGATAPTASASASPSASESVSTDATAAVGQTTVDPVKTAAESNSGAGVWLAVLAVFAVLGAASFVIVRRRKA